MELLDVVVVVVVVATEKSIIPLRLDQSFLLTYLF